VILVIGATGTVGNEVVRQLLARGEQPRAFVRSENRARQRLGDHVELAVGDLDQPETIENALARVDRLFLLTRQSSRQLDQERRVLAAARRGGVGHVVKLSVFRADEQASLQIARLHRQAEHALERSGLAYTLLRPVFFMQNLIGMVRDGAIPTAAGDGRVVLIDARDVAAVAVATLVGRGHAGETYTLTGPEALSFDDVAAILTTQVGGHFQHLRVSPETVRRALEDRGVEAWFAQDMAQLHRLLADGYEDVVTNDVFTVTNRRPRPLAQFARDFTAVFTPLSGP
jgi:uncharacterized protein YbjT (DUF2867 family)